VQKKARDAGIQSLNWALKSLEIIFLLALDLTKYGIKMSLAYIWNDLMLSLIIKPQRSKAK